ncbi:hypothetical protein HKD37_11G031503 [Glycine soja]
MEKVYKSRSLGRSLKLTKFTSYPELRNKLGHMFGHEDNAKKLWDELKERFTKGNYFIISDLLQEIHFIKQRERSVTDFFTELKILWDELDMVSPTQDCSCTVKYTSDLIKSIQKKQEIEPVICFLKGLGEVYGTVKSNILMMDPFPSINKAYALVLQQEGQLQGNGTSDSKNNQGNWRPQGRRGNNFGRGKGNGILGRGDGNVGRGRGHNYTSKQCIYCNKFGHTVDQCYSKHGFPSGFKPRKNSAINNFVASEGEQSQSEIDNSL